MRKALVVETNFLTALAFDEKSRGCDVLYDAAASSLVKLMVPAASVAEVVKSWEARRREWNGLHGKLREAERIAARSEPLVVYSERLGAGREAVLQMIDRAEAAVWERLLGVVPACEQIATDAAVLATARDNLEFLEGPGSADALVVAAATVAASSGRAGAFLTLDKRLARKTSAFFADRGIELFTDCFAALRALGVDPTPLVAREEFDSVLIA